MDYLPSISHLLVDFVIVVLVGKNHASLFIAKCLHSAVELGGVVRSTLLKGEGLVNRGEAEHQTCNCFPVVGEIVDCSSFTVLLVSGFALGGLG